MNWYIQSDMVLFGSLQYQYILSKTLALYSLVIIFKYGKICIIVVKKSTIIKMESKEFEIKGFVIKSIKKND